MAASPENFGEGSETQPRRITDERNSEHHRVTREKRIDAAGKAHQVIFHEEESRPNIWHGVGEYEVLSETGVNGTRTRVIRFKQLVGRGNTEGYHWFTREEKNLGDNRWEEVPGTEADAGMVKYEERLEDASVEDRTNPQAPEEQKESHAA